MLAIEGKFELRISFHLHLRFYANYMHNRIYVLEALVSMDGSCHTFQGRRQGLDIDL